MTGGGKTTGGVTRDGMDRIAASLRLAFDHHQTGRFDEAEALYRRVLGADPGQPVALHRCGLLVAQLGRLEEADRLLARSTAVDPLDAEMQVNRGKVLRALRHPDAAAVRFRHAVVLRPALAAALEGLGHAERERGDPASSAVGYGRAVLCGGGAAVAHQWGVALDAAGHPGLAVDALRQACGLDPTATAAPLLLATILHRVGRTAEAAGWWRQVLILRPDHADALNALAHTEIP